MTPGTERRNRLVVNRPLQGRIVLSISLPFVLAMTGCAVTVGWFCLDLTQEVIEAGVDLPSLVPFFFTVMALLVVSAAGLLYHLYRFSHRIAGPMINIRRALNAIQDGRLDTRIKLRKHDLLMEAADDLNVFLDWLQEHPPTGVPTAAPADEGVETPATAIASHAGSAS